MADGNIFGEDKVLPGDNPALAEKHIPLSKFFKEAEENESREIAGALPCSCQ